VGERGTALIRPAAPKPEEPRGSRALGCIAVLLGSAVLYAGGVAWLAHSFGARNEGGTGDFLLLPEAGKSGSEVRAMLEERLRRLKGKSFGCAVAPAGAWEPLKPLDRGDFIAVPPGTRVLDLHDASTCVALRAIHGTEFYLSVLASFSIESKDGPAVVVRLEAAIHGKNARLAWTDVFTERQGWDESARTSDPRLPDPLMMALRAAAFRAVDRVGDALEAPPAAP
jgi:hypothetical protein